MEVCHPTVPFDARLEMVLTEDDAFLASINHRRLARSMVLDRLLIRVSLDNACKGREGGGLTSYDSVSIQVPVEVSRVHL